MSSRAFAIALAVATSIVAVGLSAGCPPPDDDDDVPPRVVGVAPVAPIVPVTTSFTVSFSEEINDKTVDADPVSEGLTVLLLPRFNADGELTLSDTFLSDIDNPPLIESRQDDLVPIIVALVDGDAGLTVSPRSPLDPGTAYTLLVSGNVRDNAGNPLVNEAGVKAPFQWDFVTDAGTPEVVSTDLGGVVVPNRKRITVEFNQPVQGVDTNSLRIEPAVAVAAILVDGDRRSATIVIADPPAGGGCQRFQPGVTYALVGTSDIIGDGGEAMASYNESFGVDAICDDQPNLMSNLERIASDVSATIRFTTTKPSTTEVRFGRAGGQLDCDGGPCPVVGAPTTAANAVHTVTIAGLTVNVDYAFVAFAEDQVGSVATQSGTFRTEPLPKVSVNEAMQDASNDLFESDSEGEFVEITSFEESADTSLIGWALRVTKADDEPDDCPFPVDAPTIEPGGFVVLADTGFVETGYDIPATATVVEFSGFCSLVNEPLVIELIDPSGRPVSSLTTPTPREGVSVERTAPDAPDDAATVCYAREDTGPTPGRENGTRLGCDSE